MTFSLPAALCPGEAASSAGHGVPAGAVARLQEKCSQLKPVWAQDTSHTVPDLTLPDKKPSLLREVFPGVLSIGNKQLQAFVTDLAATKERQQDLEFSV